MAWKDLTDKEKKELQKKAEKLLAETDEFIANTEAMLEQFEKDDEEWRRKGRKLGFDF